MRAICLVLGMLIGAADHARGQVSRVAGDTTITSGGSAVHVRVSGTGQPTIVLVAGLGNTIGAWDSVAARVALNYRVVRYDRPGLGASAPGTMPRTVGRMANELHALLADLRLAPPYVLCGHSLGGFIVELFASRYPNEVAGLILVDPSVEEFYVRAESLPEYRAQLVQVRQLMAQAPPGVSAEQAAFDSSRAEMQAMGPLPPVPIRMLISIHHGAASPTVEQLWRETHVQWAQAHAGGQYVVDERSGHYIQLENPTLVTQAIQSLVELVRSSRSGRSVPPN